MSVLEQLLVLEQLSFGIRTVVGAGRCELFSVAGVGTGTVFRAGIVMVQSCVVCVEKLAVVGVNLKFLHVEQQLD